MDRVIPVGYSMGGPVALLARRRHPSLVGGLVLCATSARFARNAPSTPRSGRHGGIVAADATSGPPPARARRAVRDAARDSAMSPAFVDEVRGHDPAALIEAGRALGNFDARPWLAELGCPTASIVTTRDRLVPPSRATRTGSSCSEPLCTTSTPTTSARWATDSSSCPPSAQPAGRSAPLATPGRPVDTATRRNDQRAASTRSPPNGASDRQETCLLWARSVRTSTGSWGTGGTPRSAHGVRGQPKPFAQTDRPPVRTASPRAGARWCLRVLGPLSRQPSSVRPSQVRSAAGWRPSTPPWPQRRRWKSRDRSRSETI